MQQTAVEVTAASLFSPGSGSASSFGALTLNHDLKFTGGAAGTLASFAGITANASATIGNDTGDVTGLAISSGNVSVAANQSLTIGAQVVNGAGTTALWSPAPAR